MKNYISEIRKSLNLTQEQFGDRLNVTQSTISSWEKGRTDIDLASLVKMSEEFGVSIDRILTGKEHGLSVDEMDTIMLYRSMTEQQRKSIHDIIKSINLVKKDL